jgi:CheY-like chemotaxis protein
LGILKNKVKYFEINKVILQIDDNLLHVKFVEDVVRYWGYEITSIPSVDEIFKLIEPIKPNLILLDLHLPGSSLDGFEILNALKTTPETQHIPVIVLSVQMLEDEIQRAVALGCDSYLTKPVNILTLQEQITRLIQARC